MREEADYFLHNTFGIKAKARHFVEYESVEELQAVVRCGKRAGMSGCILLIWTASQNYLSRRITI